MDRALAFAIGSIVAGYAVLVWAVLAILPKDISEDLKDEVLGYCQSTWVWVLWVCSKWLPGALLSLLRVETLVVAIFALVSVAMYHWPAHIGEKSDDDEADITVVHPLPDIKDEPSKDAMKLPPQIQHLQSPRRLNPKKSIDMLKLSNTKRRSSRSYNDVLADIAAVNKDDKKSSSFSVPDDLGFDENKDWWYDRVEPMSAADLDTLEASMDEAAKQQKDEGTDTPQPPYTHEVEKVQIPRKNVQVTQMQNITTLLALPPPLTFTPPDNDTTRALTITTANEDHQAELTVPTPTPTHASPRLPTFNVRAATLRYEEREGIAAKIGQERRARLRKLAAETRANRLADYAKWKGRELKVQVPASAEGNTVDQVADCEEGKKDEEAHEATDDIEEVLETNEAIARIDSEAEVVGGYEIDDVIVEGAFFPGA